MSLKVIYYLPHQGKIKLKKKKIERHVVPSAHYQQICLECSALYAPNCAHRHIVNQITATPRSQGLSCPHSKGSDGTKTPVHAGHVSFKKLKATETKKTTKKQ